MTVNNNFRKIIDCFWRKHCRDSLCQTSSVVFFKSILAFFFLKRSLIERCQIVTDTCKNNFSKFVGSLLNHLYHYANENVSVKLLSLICINLYFKYHLLAQNCFVYSKSCCNYSPNSFRFFWRYSHFTVFFHSIFITEAFIDIYWVLGLIT